jgi:hypothetical protein
MALPLVNNGDLGLDARTKWNDGLEATDALAQVIEDLHNEIIALNARVDDLENPTDFR